MHVVARGTPVAVLAKQAIAVHHQNKIIEARHVDGQESAGS